MVKAEGERIPRPGQKYWHGWVPVDAGAVDTLGLASKRPPDKTGGVIYHASHRVEGVGNTPVGIHISSANNDEDPPEIGVETLNPESEHAHLYTDERGGPVGAVLDAKGARQTADHLRDLATIAESGQKIDQPKPTKHSRAIEAITHMAQGESEDFKLSDKIPLGYNDNELPITYKDLLELLAPHVAAPTMDQKKLRRVVKRPHSHDEGGYDSGDTHMHLDTTGAQPIIHVTGRERGQGPWDPATDVDTAHLTPAAARALAEKLDQYANALPKPVK